MLTEYIRAALLRAHYDKLEDGTFYGEIPELRGVYANAPTLEGCREELRSGLDDWILFGLANRLPIPPLDGIDLTKARVA